MRLFIIGHNSINNKASAAVFLPLLLLASSPQSITSFAPSPSLSNVVGGKATNKFSSIRPYPLVVVIPNRNTPCSSSHGAIKLRGQRTAHEFKGDNDIEEHMPENLFSEIIESKEQQPKTDHQQTKAITGQQKNDTHIHGIKTISRPLSDLLKFIRTHQTALITAAVIFFTVLFASPLQSFAVQSGGRIGGGDFSSGRSSSSYSAPSRSYSSGYNRGYSRGFGSGYSTRPNVVVSPGYYSSPFYSPFSWWGAPRVYSPGVTVVSRGPSIIDLFVWGGFAFVLWTVFSTFTRGGGDGDGSSSLLDDVSSAGMSALGSGISVVSMSVALDVPDRDSPNSILSTLKRLANTARTDSRVGIQNLTSQVALELLRRKQSIIGASTNYRHYRDRSKAQREYNTLSIRERGKFERETVSKYKGVDYSQQQGSSQRSSISQDTFTPQATAAVVTIILAIEGDSTKVPRVVGSMQDVEEALSRIASDSKVDNCLQTAEILWTPEERTETLTRRDVFADYPDIRTV